MNLNQFQIIQSLGKNLEWFQTEVSWGIQAQELRQLTGRIGELYTAMITDGQLALENNQRGYDVVSSKGERISVKTITSSIHVSFNKSTLQFVDRVVILRINMNDLNIEVLVDELLNDFFQNPKLRSDEKSYIYPINTSEGREIIDFSKLSVSAEVEYGSYKIQQYENGSILVYENGKEMNVAKPILRELAKKFGVSLINSAGAQKNTRQLGDQVIREIQAEKEPKELN